MSARFEIDSRQLSRELRKRAMGARAAVVRGTRSAAYRGQAHLVRVAKDMGKVDRGEYRAGFRVEGHGINPRPAGGESVGYEIVNQVPYAGIVELGARPHPVSAEGIAALEGYARRKLGLDAVNARSFAFAVAAKLKKKGQKPTYLVRGQLPELRAQLVAEVEAQLAKYSGGKA